MELKALAVGVLFSVLAFSIKGGIGLFYRARASGGHRIIVLAYLLLYGLLFFGAHLASRCAIARPLMAALSQIAGSGVLIHILVAIGLILWGVLLLVREWDGCEKTGAVWFLLLPCPVCLLVIISSSAILSALLPDAGAWPALLAYGTFVLLSFGTAGVMALASRLARGSRHLARSSGLGTAMAFIGAYFLILLMIAPNISNLSDVYRLSSRTYPEETAPSSGSRFLLAGTSVGLFSAGYVLAARRLRRSSS